MKPAGTTPLACASSPRHGLGLAADDVLVCSTGLIGIPMPMDALEAGIPKICGELAADGGGRRGAGDHDHRHRGEGGGRPRRRGDRRRDGKGRGDAVAGHGHDARGGHHRCRRRPRHAATRAGARGERELRLPVGRRLPIDERHRPRARQRPRRRGRPARAARTRSTDVCGSLAEQMARDAEGATKFVRVEVVGARSAAEAQVAARAVANSQLVQCSLNGNDPYWGRVLSELGASGAHLDPEAVDISYNGITVCRDGVACAHDETALARASRRPTSRSWCDLRLEHGEATCSPPTFRTPTSTRTGAPRERATRLATTG